jgi:hypothetical protein
MKWLFHAVFTEVNTKQKGATDAVNTVAPINKPLNMNNNQKDFRKDSNCVSKSKKMRKQARKIAHLEKMLAIHLDIIKMHEEQAAHRMLDIEFYQRTIESMVNSMGNLSNVICTLSNSY